MLEQDCKIGTRVAYIRVGYDLSHKGTIKSAAETLNVSPMTSVVIVEWDNKYLEKIDIKTLLTEAQGLKYDEKKTKEKNRLEAEFQQVSTTIATKIETAAELIEEARLLAKSTKHDITEMYDAIRPLKHAIDNLGWRSSSYSC
jgi:hypothetical protein